MADSLLPFGQDSLVRGYNVDKLNRLHIINHNNWISVAMRDVQSRVSVKPEG